MKPRDMDCYSVMWIHPHDNLIRISPFSVRTKQDGMNFRQRMENLKGIAKYTEYFPPLMLHLRRKKR